MYKILVINLGSTSTKVAFYEDEKCVVKNTLEHAAVDLQQIGDIMDQFDFRLRKIEDFMLINRIATTELDAVVSRGGQTKPLVSGIYEICPEMLAQQASGEYGRHPTDLGSKIAYQLAKGKTVALVVDPPVTDEFEPYARLSGYLLINRKSSFHALSHKATAKRYAQENGLKYEDLNLVVVHLGGGISVAAHRKGQMIDGDNGLDGDGPFATNRTGGLPVGDLVKLCFSGRYTCEQILKMLNGLGGLVAYLGESDVKVVEERAKTDPTADLCLNAMIYQVCKSIGAQATVLEGKVDAILVTGGIAHSESIIEKIRRRCQYIAPMVVYPGENEMDALANGALAGLRNIEEVKDFNYYSKLGERVVNLYTLPYKDPFSSYVPSVEDH